ncbi:juvenile hormone epoxide hydrolase-like [Helicoverpa zea]|uniref:juvenile hormone epoxide hydrolase-like n=1 Tax=Helicoverpa zea TaxID=7113 RepID=UPI001F57FF23|nr:juvenile hormone epoxide hydrolase-like [Helicoverpa zea]
MQLFLEIIFVCCSLVSVQSLEIFRTPPLPHFDHEWWGPVEEKQHNDTSIRPFQVHFDPGMIEDLRYRLKSHRPFTPPLEGVGFEYGFNTHYLHGWVDYWADQYPFQQQEDFLNQFPQFKTNVQGLDIHFIWVKPEVPPGMEVVPLLLLHGWPGSVREFYGTLPMLATVSRERDFAVEVIAPSLPGFGFSDAAVRPGLGATEMGVVLRNLMHRLGFKKFYVQGGDWGAYIGLCMATLYPKEVLGYHTNLALSITPTAILTWVLGSIYPPLVVDPVLADRMYPILSVVYWLTRETGYLHLQATKPDTLGVSMADSPAGLLAYIYQLFSSGSRRKFYYRSDGGFDDLYSRDELIDNLMIYWITNSFTTSSRIYAETLNLRNINMAVFAIPTPVPTWTIHAKDEIFYQSPTLLKFKYPNLLNSTVLFTGGHFLALEKPQVFADDVLHAIAAFRRWHFNRKHKKYTF